MRKRPNRRLRLLWRWGGLSVACTLVVGAAIVAVGRHTSQAVPAAGAKIEGLTSVLSRDVGDVAIPIRLQDVTAEVGVSFRHFPATRSSVLPEDMGSGVAAADFDDDGFADLLLVNFAGSILPGNETETRRGRTRLFRNVAGRRFEDVTDRVGIDYVGFGMGAAWGDYDSDGDLDLYITAYGENRLYRHEADGTMRDVTAAVGVQDTRFSAGCAWADYDRDGDLDLYVSNYVDFVFREGDRKLMERQYATEQPFTLNPSAYPPVANSLFRNRGDGTFEEVAAEAGVANPDGRSLSASWLDMDDDGWPDLYVANDVSHNGVFRNLGNGRFADIGSVSLAADYRGAMGIAVADFDDDLDLDLLVTHWIAQENALFRNMLRDRLVEDAAPTDLWFLDAADELGLGQTSLDMVGWATGFADFDNDGRRDLWLVDGNTLEDAQNHRLLVPQPALLFWNRGPDGFVDVAAAACPRLAEPFVGRGGAQLDYDHDGRLDLAILVHGGEAFVLRNTSPAAGHWIRLRLRQQGGNTAALGARGYVTAGGHTYMAEQGSSASYLSQDETVLHFGLGKASRIDALRIVWPDGAEESRTNLEADQTLSFVHQPVYPVSAKTGNAGQAPANVAAPAS